MAPKAGSTPDATRFRFGQEEPYNFDCLTELFEKDYAPPSNRTIHFGCSSGRVSVWCALLGQRVLGIDADRELIAAARERSALAGVELDFMAGEPLELPPLPEESFGLAIDFRVAAAMADGMEREGYLRRIHTFLMRNGILITSAAAPRQPRPTARRNRALAFAGPFVSDITRAGFRVLFEGVREIPGGERRLIVHAKKPG